LAQDPWLQAPTAPHQHLTSTMAQAAMLAGRGFGGLAAVAAVPALFMFNVDAGERVLMWTMTSGLKREPYQEGTHLKFPYVMRPVTYDVKARAYEIPTNTGTKDMQNVQIHVRLLFRPDVERLWDLHQELGVDYETKLLPSVCNEILKSIVAQYDAEALLTMRERVSQEIRDGITERCDKFGIIIEDVAITHLNYSKEFAKAIEEKQVAEQEAERQKFIVQLEEQKKRAAIIRAEGDAEAAVLMVESMKAFGKGIVEVRRIEAAQQIADTLARAANVMYLPGGQNTLLSLGGK